MKLCPFCASENIFFSKKRNRYFCEDCDNGFETPASLKGMRVFLSYGHDKNAEIVKKIKTYLAENGYDVWIDSSEIPAGKNWRERITNGLLGSNGVLSFLSKHSVRDPGVCLDELKIAVCLKHAYIKTVLLENEDEVNPPHLLRDTQWLDLSDWSRVSEREWDGYFQTKMNQLTAMLNSDDAVEYNNELEFLSRRLNVVHNTAKEQRLLKQVFVGRDWLTEKVTDWLASADPDPFLICGVPGSGKSAFAANFTRFNTDVLASLFFEWDHQEHLSTDAVIKDLAFKLAVGISDYRRMLVNLFSDPAEENKISQYRGVTLFDRLILTPLQCCIGGDRKTGLIVIDGLDETTSEIADLLIQKSAYFPDWIKILFTSRFDETLIRRIKPSNTVMLDHSHARNDEDLCRYLACRMELDADDPTVRNLAKKCEGSFMYAATFCDGIDSGSMSLDDVHSVPFGLNHFYRSFFQRLFPTDESFRELRPLLELICVDQDVPEEIIAGCLKTDHYGLMELRLLVKSLITATQSNWDANGSRTFKTVKFTHQSIKDWLTDPRYAGEFSVNACRGYRRLAEFYEEGSLQKTVSSLKIPIDNTEWYRRLNKGMKADEITEETVREFQREMDDWKKATEKSRQHKAHLEEVLSFAQNHYVKWLILGGEYGKVKEMLLSSFDAEKMKQSFDPGYYQQYYKFLPLWQWADTFPLTDPVEDLVEKLSEIVLFPKNYVVSRYAHRSFQISMLILSRVMDSGRYAPVFYNLMRAFPFAAYFTSHASDDGETRDGWDKYYLTRDAVICLKKLEKLGIAVPSDVRKACEEMKLTYFYDRAAPEGGMFFDDTDTGSGTWTYGILCEKELFKDLCTLDLSEEGVSESKRRLLCRYNTASLRFYLANSAETDLDFIRRCISLHADPAKAEALAIQEILHKRSPAAKEEELTGKDAERIRFIRSLPDVI